jgi:TetR/AcrR family transcriptional repressor of nem operon
VEQGKGLLSSTKPALGTSPRPAGRPRGFDVVDVLNLAIPVFCEHGYDGASIGLLTEATGLKAGSLYKAFKDKKGLFAAAFAQYSKLRKRQLVERVKGSPSGRERVAETLRFHLSWQAAWKGGKDVSSRQ